jgi:ferric-dicitrate binding protein FerR (iron transport regulator)
MLTLADGRTITLDDVQNGILTKEGNTAVSKKDGIVMYHSPAGDAQPAAIISYNTLTTPRGGQYQLVLPDGSKVWLNAASSIKYPTAFTGNERKVEVTGEGYFEVAKNASMPFHVQVNNMDVEVLGTHFNINGYSDEPSIRTTLLEGSVKVRQWSMVNGQLKTENEALLKPGEQAALAGTHSPLTTHHSPLTIDHSPNTEEVMAWKNGLFQFQDASIESIMRQVARWYDVQIEYKGKINNEFIGKIPRHVPVSSVLNILESTGWVHFTIVGKKIIVAP